MLQVELLENGVLDIRIEHPPVNAFSIGMLDELAAVLNQVQHRPEVKSVLVSASGRGFCAGGDVKEVEKLPAFEGIQGQVRGSTEACLAALNCAVPVITAVHGYCIGVGVLFAGCSDILVAADKTPFVLSEVDNGATSGALFALRLMPENRVRAAMMTADPVYAEELFNYGTVYRVVPETETYAAARELAERVALKSEETVRRLKQSINNTTGAAEYRARYRAEASYTYELNIRGVASEGRSDFIDKKRASYLDGDSSK